MQRKSKEPTAGVQTPSVPITPEMLMSKPVGVLDLLIASYGGVPKSEQTIKDKIDYIINNNAFGTPVQAQLILESFKGHEAKVFVDFSLTINTGDYNSFKIGGGATVSVDASKEDISNAMRVWKEVLAEVKENVYDEAAKELKKKGK